MIATSGRPGNTQFISYTGTPLTSAAVGPYTNRVRLVTTAAALVSIGLAVTFVHTGFNASIHAYPVITQRS